MGRRALVRAHAKINLDLRVGDRRPDGYHEIATVFQALSLHDRLIVREVDGPLAISCTDPAVPTGLANLCLRAVERLWHAVGRAGEPHGIAVEIDKRIPVAGGLGGGSSDAAAVLRVLDAWWGPFPREAVLARVATGLGADVAYFLLGGTVLGTGRGDRLRALPDLRPTEVVLVQPGFGLSTAEVYAWFDETIEGRALTASRRGPPGGEVACRNDLEVAVARRHPAIQRLVATLRGLGARLAAMTGSGSTVFGLFDQGRDADEACATLAATGYRALRARTLTAAEYRVAAAPVAHDTDGGQGPAPSGGS